VRVNKKVLSLLLVMLFVLSLGIVACGNEDPAPAPAPAPKDEEVVTYPITDKPVKILVGHNAGGSTDLVVRLVQPYLQKYLGTPVVIENVAGSGGQIAANQAYKADPDGYTLLTFPNPTYVLIDKFLDNAPPFQEFEFIGNIAGKESTGIAVAADSKIKTLDDLIEAGKKQDLLYSCTSGLSNSTLGYVLLSEKAGIKFNKIPYESGSKSVAAIIGNNADVTITSTMTLTPLLKNKELNVLAYFAEEELPGYEGIPLFSEKYPGASYVTFVGLVAPPGTPKEIVEVIDAALEKATSDPEYIELTQGKYSVEYMGSDDYQQRVLDLYDSAEELRSAIEASLED
jgi:tripartite-type tricarboxylate transporter receptor subunit TctC